jgi:hypothetical protein
MLRSIITHAIAVLAGGGIGYWLKSVGAKTAVAQVQAGVAEVKKIS